MDIHPVVVAFNVEMAAWLLLVCICVTDAAVGDLKYFKSKNLWGKAWDCLIWLFILTAVPVNFYITYKIIFKQHIVYQFSTSLAMLLSLLMAFIISLYIHLIQKKWRTRRSEWKRAKEARKIAEKELREHKLLSGSSSYSYLLSAARRNSTSITTQDQK